MKKYKCSYCSNIDYRILAPTSVWENGKLQKSTYAFTCQNCSSFSLVE